MSQRVALIPARGGSKRLPRKNILDFQGKPMIAYSIEAALESDCFDCVVVSTEDSEIAEIALQFGAVVDERSQKLATDSVTVSDVCLHYLNQHDVAMLAVLYATAPLRNADDVRSVVALLSGDCHFAMAATTCDWPVHQTLTFNAGHVAPVFPELVNQRADQLDTYCIDNGSTYAVHVDQFIRQKSFYGDSLKAYLMSNARSIDIDTPSDYYRALYEAGKTIA